MTVDERMDQVASGPPARVYGSDHLATLLGELGYRYVALNPGATFRGLHDSFANLEDAPRIIMTTHEEIAVAIAHGYAKAAGEPMAAAVHDVVGLQHATMAIFNAWCDQAPVLILGGTGPVDAAHRRPFIDWVHTALVQGQLVRDYVKWDDQPASVAAAQEAIVRGDRIARAEPPGPVYVCFDVELQEARVEDPGPVTLAARPTPIHPDPAAIQAIADRLVEAERPLVIADMSGRDPAAFAALVQLAERLALPVIDLGGRLNFPASHPFAVTGAPDLEPPDLILALDVVDLAGHLRRLPADAARPPLVVHVSTRDLSIRSWAMNYQALPGVDFAVPAATGATLTSLVRAVQERDVSVGATERADRLTTASQDRRASWERAAAESAAEHPIALGWLFLQLRTALEGRPWSLVNGPIESPWPFRLLRLDEPWQYLGGSGGAGIGYAAGASVGAALALRDRGVLAVGVQGDGDLLYTPGAIWTAVHERIPILLVIANNRSYFNSEHHADTMARMRGRPPENAAIGTRISDPDVDFASLARALGAEGYGPVDEPGELRNVLVDAVQAVSRGAVAVVDVITQPR